MARRPARQRGDEEHQPLGAITYAVIAFISLGLTLIVACGVYYASDHAASAPTLRLFFYLLLAVLGVTSALFFFGVLRSAASLTGTYMGSAVALGGPVVLGVLVVAGGYEFIKLPDSFTLTVRLQGPYPPQQMAQDTSVVIDLGGRREVTDFGPDGQAVVQDVSEVFLTQAIDLTLQSSNFRATDNSNPITLKVPANHVVNLTVEQISEEEKQRAALVPEYRIILVAINRELESKGSDLFPAIDDYVANPSVDRWLLVKRYASESLNRIDAARDQEANYDADSDLIALFDDTRTTIGRDNTLPQTPQRNPRLFVNALQIHRAREATLNDLPPGSLPTVDSVKVWETDVKHLYRQMQGELVTLVQNSPN